MGWVEYTLGNLQQAVLHNERGLALCESLSVADSALRWRLETDIGMSHAMGGRHVDAEQRLERALALYTPDWGESAQATAGYAFGHLALLHADRGDFPACAAALERARGAVERSGHYALLGALATIEGMTRAFAGDWDGCARCASQVREVAERIDGAYQRQMAAALEGLHLVHGAGDAAGLGAVRGAALGLESRGVGLALSWCFASLADALVLHGRPEEAIVHADAALARAAGGDALGQVTALRARALARGRLGDAPGAEQDFAAAETAAEAKRSARELALCALYRVEAGIAAADRAALSARFEALHMTWYAERARRLA